MSTQFDSTVRRCYPMPFVATRPMMLFALIIVLLIRALPSQAQQPAAPSAAVVEAEDFKPQSTPDPVGWKVVFNGQGNYMVDTIGFNHISGERLLSTDAHVTDAQATTITILEAGDYRVWSRFEQPTNTENRFRVEIRQVCAPRQLSNEALSGVVSSYSLLRLSRLTLTSIVIC